MPYEWLHTAFAVIAVRGIEPYEVLQVLYGPSRRPVPVRSPIGLPFLDIWGRTKTGRPLIVTLRRTSGFDALIVGAREMNGKEQEEFEAWETSR